MNFPMSAATFLNNDGVDGAVANMATYTTHSKRNGGGLFKKRKGEDVIFDGSCGDCAHDVAKTPAGRAV